MSVFKLCGPTKLETELGENWFYLKHSRLLSLSLSLCLTTPKIYTTVIRALFTILKVGFSPNISSLACMYALHCTAALHAPSCTTNKILASECVRLLLGKACEYIPNQMVAGATRSVVSTSDSPEHSRVPVPHFESYTDHALRIPTYLHVSINSILSKDECKMTCIRFKSCCIRSYLTFRSKWSNYYLPTWLRERIMAYSYYLSECLGR